MGLVLSTMVISCSRVEPNYEGVLMENYGRNGKEDFSTVSGRQWTFFPGVELYQVPMFETSGDPQAVQVSAKDAGVFTVDPSYQYQPIRGKGVDIVFNKQVENRLKKDFENKFFQLNNLTSGLKPPASMAKAIELRNNAVQQAEQVKNELQVSKMNLEKAKIDAEANRVKSQGLDGKLLQEKWIEAIRNTNNKVIITDGRTPVIFNQ